jgi:hypothetical protein
VWNSIGNGGAMHVMDVSQQSWDWRYIRGLLGLCSKNFLSCFYFPYATACILSFIVWFALVLWVQGLHLGNSSTLLSRLSHSSYTSPSLPALHITYLNPSVDHLLYKVASSQQVQPKRHPQISSVTSCSNTAAPLSDDGLHHSTSNLGTLNDLSVTDLSHIDTTSIQELCQALG